MTYAVYIDGKFQTGEGAPLVVENPSDESIVETLPGASLAQTAAAIRSARQAFERGDWSGLSATQRAEAMRRFARALSGRLDRLRELAVLEAGCPVGGGTFRMQAEVPLRQTEEIIELFLTLPEFEENHVPLRERTAMPGPPVQSIKYYSPIGVIAGIPANNVPFFTAMWKVFPALITGNTMVLRPNPLTPLSAMVFAEAADEAGLPPGVLNVLLEAGHEGGELLSTDPDVDMVAFTGSSAVGVKVMAQAAATMKRLQLELGGKSAQIFLPDAAGRAAMHAKVVCTAHAGQGCSLGTRIFVPEDRKAEVLERAAAMLADIRVGPASDPDTQTGPVVSAAQRDRCEEFVRLARDSGARVVTGGKRPAHLSKGFFFEPTVLDVPDNRNPAAQEEIFGPVVSVIGYRDIDHAVAMANDSRYGLSGYVHGEDRQAALAVALRMRTGNVHINGSLSSAYVSFGGQRMSGIGRERGPEGLRTFQQLTSITLG